MAFVTQNSSMQLLDSKEEAHDGTVWCCKSHPLHPNIVVSTGADRAVKFWSVADGSFKFLCELQDVPHNRTIRNADWSDDGKYLALASFDATTSVFTVDFDADAAAPIKASIVSVLEGHESEVKCAAWSHVPLSEQRLATCSRDKSIWIWARGDFFGEEYECIAIKHEHTQDVKYVAWHPHAPILFSASYDCAIRVWADEDDDWQCVEHLADAHASTVWSLAFDGSGRFMASVADDGTLKLWTCDNEFRNWHCVQTIAVSMCDDGMNMSLFSVTWHTHADLLAIGCRDNHVHIAVFVRETCRLRLADEFLPTFQQSHLTDVNAVCWCASDDQQSLLIVSGSDDGTLKLWRLLSA